jgi:Kef-type K+ transport system membrane component KefB/nucleotide-binding universal stress UspA family protein
MDLFPDIKLPFEDPILIFTLVLLIIFLTPILFRRFKIPGILGLLLAGVIVGPNGFNLLMRDASIVLFGTVGLLYIMFLAGLEIDLAQFKKRKYRSLVFGLLTFLVPQATGTLVAYYLLNFNLISSILLASMFASHTLLSYPIVSKLGITKTEAATITFGGTLITNVLALLILSIIVAVEGGTLDTVFWIKLAVLNISFGLLIFLGIPSLSNWFFKNFEGEGLTHYLYVLAIVFGSSFLAGLFMLEPILGAFFAGLALNRLIPGTSALMNRIEFVGNAFFIPFFLIGTGMLIDLKVFFTSTEAIIVGVTMVVVATFGKWVPAYLVQKIYRYLPEDRNLIFGLSNAQAASTLAAVVIGFNIGLFNENVLNGTILMILVTCFISTIVTENAGRKIAIRESRKAPEVSKTMERILVPVSNPASIDHLMDLAFFIKDHKSAEPVFPLTIVVDETDPEILKEKIMENQKTLEKAIHHASSMEKKVQLINKVDYNIPTGIIRACSEYLITHLVIGWNGKITARERIFGSILDQIVQRLPLTVLVHKPAIPLNTIRRIVLAAPPNAELEFGFEKWLRKVVRISAQTKAKIQFIGSIQTLGSIEQYLSENKILLECDYQFSERWNDYRSIGEKLEINDLLIIVSARKGTLSYSPEHDDIPKILSRFFFQNSFIILYPEQKIQNYQPDSNLQFEQGNFSPFSQKVRNIGKFRKMVGNTFQTKIKFKA